VINRIRFERLILPVALLAFLATDSCFTLIEDEVTIVNAAQSPARETIRQFVSGSGQHEHPPLSDILLHLRSEVGGSQSVHAFALFGIATHSCFGTVYAVHG